MEKRKQAVTVYTIKQNKGFRLFFNLGSGINDHDGAVVLQIVDDEADIKTAALAVINVFRNLGYITLWRLHGEMGAGDSRDFPGGTPKRFECHHGSPFAEQCPLCRAEEIASAADRQRA